MFPFALFVRYFDNKLTVNSIYKQMVWSFGYNVWILNLLKCNNDSTRAFNSYGRIKYPSKIIPVMPSSFTFSISRIFYIIADRVAQLYTLCTSKVFAKLMWWECNIANFRNIIYCFKYFLSIQNYISVLQKIHTIQDKRWYPSIYTEYR